jgi:hypothetical protein
MVGWKKRLDTSTVVSVDLCDPGLQLMMDVTHVLALRNTEGVAGTRYSVVVEIKSSILLSPRNDGVDKN